MDGKVGEDFPREPELGDAGMVGGRVPDGQGGGQVLVQGGHDDHGQRGVEQVVTPDKDGVKHTLHKDKGRVRIQEVLISMLERKMVSWVSVSLQPKLEGIL